MKECDLAYLVLKADSYMDVGIPLKDAMDDYEVKYAISYLAEQFKLKGYSYNEDED